MSNALNDIDDTEDFDDVDGFNDDNVGDNHHHNQYHSHGHNHTTNHANHHQGGDISFEQMFVDRFEKQHFGLSPVQPSDAPTDNDDAELEIPRKEDVLHSPTSPSPSSSLPRSTSYRLSVSRRQSFRFERDREAKELAQDEVAEHQPTRQRASVYLKPSSGLSIDAERLKERDIQMDANSLAERALQGTLAADNRQSRRLSVRNLFSGMASAGGSEGAGARDVAADAEDPLPEKKVDGREIKQDHELYALTYGMMLGIRVMTGRADKELEYQRLYYATHGRSGDGAETGAGTAAPDDEMLVVLNDDDFSFGLELDFPPEGSNSSSTRVSLRRPSTVAEEARTRTPTQSSRSSFMSFSSSRTLGGDYDNTPSYLRDGTRTPAHKLKQSFKFKDYMPKPFRVIRNLSGIDEGDYMMSVAGDFNYIEFIANSKSGQFFFYSHDGKYMIKTQTKDESKLLREIMPQYLQHLHDFPDSLLVRFYGMYRVKMDFLSVNTIYFVVMSSVFNTEKPIHIKYDLKGSTVGRITKPADCVEGAVQKDLNLELSGRKLCFGLPNIEVLRSTLISDSKFLADLKIMDYSLLVGIHEGASKKPGRRYSGVAKNVRFGKSSGKRTVSYVLSTLNADSTSIFNSYAGGIKSTPEANEIYFIGIIDILQLYNAGKRAETIFKSLTENSAGLSSVPAPFYAQRFVDFIMKHTDYDDIVAQCHDEEERREREWHQALEEHVKKGGNPKLFPKEAIL